MSQTSEAPQNNDGDKPGKWGPTMMTLRWSLHHAGPLKHIQQGREKGGWMTPEASSKLQSSQGYPPSPLRVLLEVLGWGKVLENVVESWRFQLYIVAPNKVFASDRSGAKGALTKPCTVAFLLTK